MIDHGFSCSLIPLSEVSPRQMLEWRNDPDVYKWCRQYEPIESWAHEKWLLSLESRSDVKMYGIKSEDPGEDSEVVGVCGLTSLDFINRRAEFSLYIGPDHQGKGYGEGALKTLLAHAFLALNLNLVWGETYEENPAAKIFERVGMFKEGVRRRFYYRDGRYIDATLYSILKSEFRSKWEL